MAKTSPAPAAPGHFTVRARVSILTVHDAGRVVRLDAVPLDGSDDHPNAAWAKRIAKALLELSISQPAEFDRFNHGDEFDVVFMPRSK